MGRESTHVIETKSRQLFAQMLTEFSSSIVAQGDLLFREISERDYGIDGEVELFHQGEPTGRISKIQIKGTDSAIIPLKREDCVSCKNITKSNIRYCQQRNYPVILVYCSNADKKFYYIDLQSVFHEKIDINSNKESWTIRIPLKKQLMKRKNGK